jgi:2-polyprenyl-3-methyl-5-hydroxy-6-metoxy-1,4-benzoquinol methylase
MRRKLYILKKKIITRFQYLLIHFGFLKVKKLTESKDAWQREAQAFEFEFHKNENFRSSDVFIEENDLLFTSFGFKKHQFFEKTILDLGAGSRMRGKFFENSYQIIIEPMANKCIEQIKWCDFLDANELYSKPAEEKIIELENKVDFLFSINVLDHCYDFPKIIENIHFYLKPGGLTFLSFDSHFTTSIGHPLILTKKICDDIFVQKGFQITKFSTKFNKPYFSRFKKPGYDNTSDCLNYWLIKK